ncbi:MAG: DUF1778 domain-containing protein [Hyphomicrobiales bacterium]|nr:DUF1778 domain-containing protein [Hyphomicrobiales bacterium]
MVDLAQKRDLAVSMRFRDEDLSLIDRGAELSGLSRTEFMRRAALHEAKLAILNETVVRLNPDAYDHFMAAIDAPVAAVPEKLKERLARPSPWKDAR